MYWLHYKDLFAKNQHNCAEEIKAFYYSKENALVFSFIYFKSDNKSNAYGHVYDDNLVEIRLD